MASLIRRTRKGFTLIELLVSVGILGVLTVLVTVNFQQGSYAEDLRYSSQLLSGAIRKMQTRASSGQTVTVDGTETVPPGGYGIFFDYELIPGFSLEPVVSYITFADFSIRVLTSCIPLRPSDTNGIYDIGCDVPENETFFRPHVQIGRFQRDNETIVELDNVPGSSMNIAFKPPKPTPIITYSTAPGASTYRVGRLRIELEHERGDLFRTITVNGVSGAISERPGRIEDSADSP